jgi:alpha-beta hydrolase superfamily lysophospholipase
MLIQHQHKPEEFDPGHCRTCARQAGLLDHYDRVQRDETRLRQARAWAYAARRYAIWALGSSGGGILLAAIALLTQ